MLNLVIYGGATMIQKISFGKAFKLFWRNYVNFTGRSRRSEYWYMVIWHLIFMIPSIVIGAISIIVFFTGLATENEVIAMIGLVLFFLMLGFGLLYSIATLIPNIALQVRRFHDTNRSMFIPILATVLGITYYLNISVINFMDPNLEHVLSWVIMILWYLTIVVIAIYQLIICCFDSDPQKNKYGAAPKNSNINGASIYNKNEYKLD